MAPNIMLIGVHGLLGGSVGFSLGIDKKFEKAKRLAPNRIKFKVLEQYQDPQTYAEFVAAARRGDIIVGAGHSLGSPDVINAAHQLGREHGYKTSFILSLDPTWNAPPPAIENSVRRVINYFGTASSLLGHAQVAPAHGYDGSLANIGVYLRHDAVDDDLGADATFLREVQWLLDPHVGSATLPQAVIRSPLPLPPPAPVA